MHRKLTSREIHKQFGYRDEIHVDFVDVWPLFAVDFDVDEILVHDGGDFLAFEAFALHDVAPVASGVAHAQEDQLVCFPRSLKGLCSPRIPGSNRELIGLKLSANMSLSSCKSVTIQIISALIVKRLHLFLNKYLQRK